MPRCSAELIRGLDLARCGEQRLVSAAASQGKGHVAHRLERTGHSAQPRVFYLVRTTHDPSHQDRAGRGHMCMLCMHNVHAHVHVPESHLVSETELDRFIYLLDLSGHRAQFKSQVMCHTASRAAPERAASLSLQVRRDVAAEKSLCGPQRALYLHATTPARHPSRPRPRTARRTAQTLR